ncbi:hypothetical protein [Citrobacter europaeus]|uniref:hypothetical protein n=1 Tax=Citrobacter europaeus TaxID=1914243 RepID=UPI001BCD7832|nr:hypothetical protein [Citrobacter europaeus]HBM9260407.1 hypothetical protein [Citrobacter freundii]
MRLTDDKIITAIFSATIKRLPREALLMVDGGYTLTPDDGYWMDKAIRISSAERSAILPGLSTARLHSLAKQNHIQTAPAGHGFTFNLPEEHLGQCWFRSREILRAACVPAYGDKPAAIDLKTVTAMASTQLAKEYYVAKTVVNDAIRWRIISSAEHGIGWYPPTEPSLYYSS